jgi:dUTPase
MVPIYVIIVESEDELGVETERGAGGFGSTGR